MTLPRAALRFVGAPVGMLAALLAVSFSRTDLGARTELGTLDARLGVRGELPLHPQVVVIDVDDETLKLLGWPLPRGFYARLLDIAAQHGARAVGFDVLFLETSDADQDALLARSARTCGCAVFPSQLAFDAALQPSGLERPAPAFAAASAAQAHVQLDNGKDGVFRTAVGTRTFDGTSLAPLALAVAQVGRVEVEPALLRADRLPIAWRSARAEQLQAHSILDVLGAAEALESGQRTALDLDALFSGALVLVGQSARSVGDRGAVPSSSDAPLVLVHANLLDNLLAHREQPPPSLLATALLSLVLALCVGLAISLLPALPGALLALTSVAALLVAAQWAFSPGASSAGLWLPVAAPLVGAGAAFVMGGVVNVALRDADERRMKKLFSRYVAPHVLEQILKSPESVDIRGHKRHLTLLFSDIKGYTTLSNTLPPDEIVDLLCSYLDTMVGILLQHEGTVDKIMGDGIMAFFGDPIAREDHALRCVKAALAMQRATQKLGETWVARGLSPLQVRIGIATGEVFVGTIGSRDHLEYTAIGRPVNLASRLEGKAPPGGVLVSRETWALIQHQVVGHEVRGLDLKGYSSGYDAFQVVGVAGEAEAALPVEQRTNSRRAFFSEVQLMVGGVSLSASSSDVSPGGMFVLCDMLPPVGARVELRGKLVRGEAVRIDAVVTHVREGKPGTAGVGLMFQSVFADDRAAILALLSGVLGEDGYVESDIREGSAHAPAAERFAYRIERQEVADGISRV